MARDEEIVGAEDLGDLLPAYCQQSSLASRAQYAVVLKHLLDRI